MIELTPEQVPDIVTRRDLRVFLVGMSERVGVVPLIGAIEWFWYPPTSARNKFYDVYGVQWQDLPWLIVAFPGSQMPRVKRLAAHLGLRIANGVPLIIGGVSVVSGRQSDASHFADLGEYFPGGVIAGRDNPRLFTIESDRNSPVYQNNRKDHATMVAAGYEINAVLNRGVPLSTKQIADYIYGSGPFPDISEDMRPESFDD